MKLLKQPRSRATQGKIVDAAARLFAIKGYHDTKLEEILQAAKVTTGAFFYHFSSKEELGFAVINRHMRKRRERLQRIEDELDTSAQDDPLEQVFRHLDAVREMVRRREHRKGGCIIGNLSTTLSDTHPAFRRRLSKCFDEMAAEFQPHLDAAVEKYCPGSSVDTAALAHYIVAVIEGSIMLTRTQKEPEGMDIHFGYLKDHIKRTLNVGEPGA